MLRYQVTIEGNRVVDVKRIEDEEEEYLGIEWALSEIKDSYRHDRRADGTYTLAGREELAEFFDQLRPLLGEDALGSFPDAVR